MNTVEDSTHSLEGHRWWVNQEVEAKFNCLFTVCEDVSGQRASWYKAEQFVMQCVNCLSCNPWTLSRNGLCSEQCAVDANWWTQMFRLCQILGNGNNCCRLKARTWLITVKHIRNQPTKVCPVPALTSRCKTEECHKVLVAVSHMQNHCTTGGRQQRCLWIEWKMSWIMFKNVTCSE